MSSADLKVSLCLNKVTVATKNEECHLSFLDVKVSVGKVLAQREEKKLFVFAE